MKTYLSPLLIACSLWTSLANGAENCTSSNKIAVCPDQLVQERVQWACQQLEEKGKSALMTINDMRFECCGEPNYVWINDFKPKMIIHPLKPNMNGMKLKTEADPTGKLLFIEFTNAATKTPEGSWVEYEWTKFSEGVPTPKKSWVRKCKAKDAPEAWVVGSGTWK